MYRAVFIQVQLKAITLANHEGHRAIHRPIKTQTLVTLSVGKLSQATLDWFWFYF